MKCPNCKYDNRNEATFCGLCYSPLRVQEKDTSDYYKLTKITPKEKFSTSTGILLLILFLVVFLLLNSQLMPQKTRLVAYQNQDTVNSEKIPLNDVVGKMEFKKGASQYSGGTGTAINYKGIKFILTAYHIFEQTTLNPFHTTSGFINSFSDVALQTISGNKISVTHPIIFPNAKSTGNEFTTCEFDNAGFLIDNNMPGLQLSKNLPMPGDKIRVIMNNGNEFPGEIREAHPEYVLYNLFNGQPGMGSSGAPILNEQNEVIGIHILGGSNPEAQFGVGNTSISVIKQLDQLTQ